MVGLKPVMRSHRRSWLLRKRLSLYSSDTEIEGVSVTGPRWAGGARSPKSSSGYAPTGGPGLGGNGAGSVAGGCSLPPARGPAAPHACAVIKQRAIPTIAPPPVPTGQGQASTDLPTCPLVKLTGLGSA